MLNDTITVVGLVATTPRHIVTSDNQAITSFRLYSSQDDGDSGNWYTVTSFGNLAMNASTSIRKGQKIIVVANVVIRDWDSEDRQSTSIELKVITLGHDLTRGCAEFERFHYYNDEDDE
jgi:single-strand DNA-binding protein